MKLSLFPYQLEFRYPFRIAHGVRTHTDVVYVKLEHDGCTAWGEATLPPYLLETQQSVISFLTDFSKSVSGNSVDEWFDRLRKESENLSAKAALDMALWGLKAQLQNKSIEELLGIKSTLFPLATYTIGVCSLPEMKLKIDDAIGYGFEMFKIKLNGETDEDMINNFRNICEKPYAVDVNQGWKDASMFINKMEWLKEKGCVLIEQPLPTDFLLPRSRVNGSYDLPVYADESCQRLGDIEKLRDNFDGVNIKLMKCGGITEAFQMIRKARELEMKVLIGCMSESSVGCSAASHLTPLADYADLDGPYLISNNPFEGMQVVNGRIQVRPVTKNSLNLQ